MKLIKNTTLILSVLLFLGCAQVPKQSVELSATIGRDIAVTQKAHVQLATLLFLRMRQDVNRFIDKTYAPYQIRNAMDRQKQLADSSSQQDNNRSLLLAINTAFSPGAPKDLQSNVLEGMKLLVEKIRKDVEAMRVDLLAPINEQEAQVLASINRAYQQLHYANSIVTGHLSSIVKVHDAQSDLLEEIGVEKDLRKDIGERIAGASKRITSIVDKAENIDSKFTQAESAIISLKDAINTLNTK